MSVNKVILIGHLGSDPETKSFDDGMMVANVNIATSETYKNKQGEKQEKTEWHSLVFWGKSAEILKRYSKKGSRIYVEGKLETRSWETDGMKKYKTEVICSTLKLMDSKPADDNQDVPF